MNFLKYLISVVLFFNQVTVYAIGSEYEKLSLEDFNKLSQEILEDLSASKRNFDQEFPKIYEKKLNGYKKKLSTHVDSGGDFPDEYNSFVHKILNEIEHQPREVKTFIELILSKNGQIPLSEKTSKIQENTAKIKFKRNSQKLISELKLLINQEAFYKIELMNTISDKMRKLTEFGKKFPDSYKLFKRKLDVVISSDIYKIVQPEINVPKKNKQNKASEKVTEAHLVGLEQFQKLSEELINLIEDSPRKFDELLTKLGQAKLSEFQLNIKKYADWGLKYPKEYLEFTKKIEKVLVSLSLDEDFLFMREISVNDSDVQDEIPIDSKDRDKFLRHGEVIFNQFIMISNKNLIFQTEIMNIYMDKLNRLYEIGKFHQDEYEKFKKKFNTIINKQFPTFNAKETSVIAGNDEEAIRSYQQFQENNAIKSKDDSGQTFLEGTQQTLQKLLKIDFSHENELQEYYLDLNESLVNLNKLGIKHPDLYKQFMVQFEELLHFKLLSYFSLHTTDPQTQLEKKRLIDKNLAQFKKYVFGKYKSLKNSSRKAFFLRASVLALIINSFVFLTGTIPQGIVTSYITLFGFQVGMSNDSNVFNSRNINKWFKFDEIKKSFDEFNINENKTLFDLENQVKDLIEDIKKYRGKNYYEKLEELLMLIRGVKKEQRFNDYQKDYYSQAMMVKFVKGLDSIYQGEDLKNAQNATIKRLNAFHLFDGHRMYWIGFFFNTVLFGLFSYTLLHFELLTFANGFLLFMAYRMSASLFDIWKNRFTQKSPFSQGKDGHFTLDKFKLNKYCQDQFLGEKY
ncbi:MAG: hypothetical protein H6622_05890 [Halobacteriovoraceae bacterium]|nr:hypothetical protein [Halobacteriovoraceae bacterium]